LTDLPAGHDTRATAQHDVGADHKSSGLSAAVVNRILNTPQLPSAVRARVLEYIEEKLAGLYGITNCSFAAQVAKSRSGDGCIQSDAK